MILFFLKAWPSINLEHLQKVDWSHIAFPYGVVLFALWGANIVPELKEIVKGNVRLLRNVIISGILISAFSYLIFIFVRRFFSKKDCSKVLLERKRCVPLQPAFNVMCV